MVNDPVRFPVKEYNIAGRWDVSVIIVSPPIFTFSAEIATPSSIEKTRKRSVYGGFWLELLSGLEPETSSLPRTRSIG